ncbi:glycoside hydrolase family 99-like domain-containing protein [Pseudomonas viridiflava]|uniref:glycoside hydrolase family 99-like domain-containing protein n=1 Tax=Pseudomonas viridiflava TaxID=33069 RepID=UPI000F01D542|nr:glycoside hydrolase family 99-like domain-containing protein [Pseudomonas viridiflava]
MNINSWPSADKEKVFKYLLDSGYRSDRYKIFYVSTPKVACTSLKWWFASLEGKVQALRSLTDSAESDPDLIIHGNNFHSLAPEVTGLGPDALGDTLSSDDFFKFAIVRNPYKRLFSAWQSKLLLQEPLQVAPYKSYDFFHHSLRDANDLALAFEGFLEHLANNEAPHYWDLHWTPQVNLLRPDLIEYSKIFKIEQSQELGQALTEWVGNYIPSPFAGRRANESLIPYLPEFVTPRSAELIRLLYAQDFQVFDYDQEPPAAKDAFSAEQLAVAFKAIRTIRARHQRLGERNLQCQNLNQAVGLRDGQIASLNEAIQARDEQVNSLNHALAERDRHAAELNQAIAVRESQNAVLSQAMAERDGHIANSSQSIADRDAQIAALSQAIAERDGQISSLNQSIVERDEQAASLSANVVERDGQIAALTHAVADRDAQIAALSKALAENEEHLKSLDHSLQSRDDHFANLNLAITQRDNRIADLSEAVSAREKQINKFKQIVAGYDHQSSAHVTSGESAKVLAKELVERDIKIAELTEYFARVESEVKLQASNLQYELDAILGSRSWHLTAPMRRVGNLLKRKPRSLVKKTIDFLRVRQNLIFKSSIREIKSSALFDEQYYVTTYPDISNCGMEPVVHYYLYGWKEHRNPSADFCTARYLHDNSDVALSGINPLFHYLKWGQKEGRNAYPVRDALPNAYVSDKTDLVDDVPPWYDLFEGAGGSLKEADVKRSTFDEIDFTTLQVPYVSAPSAVIDQQVDDISKSGLFDVSYYLAMYPFLEIKPDEAIRHYCERGWKEGLNPSDDFDSESYLRAYNDIRNANLNPFWHFVVAGASESRSGTPDSAVHYEKSIQFGTLESDIKLLAFFSSPNWATLSRGSSSSREKSRQLFPHEDLGLYDPESVEVLKRQVTLAKQHGLYGFCFELGTDGVDNALTSPVNLFLGQKTLDFGFCLNIKISELDSLKSLQDVIHEAFADERYIKIDRRPVIVLIGSDNQEDTHRLALLKNAFAEHVFIIASGFATEPKADYPFDAVTDISYEPTPEEAGHIVLESDGRVDVTPYAVAVSQGVARCSAAVGSTPVFRMVTLARDNRSQDPERAVLYSRFHIKEYRRWLDAAIDSTRKVQSDDRRFVFINAWNDWNGGVFLEPDVQSGFSRLNETSRALAGIASGTIMPKVSVLVPNYNHERFLGLRLDTIYGQTYKNIEVILMDDVSSDGSRELMNRYADQHPETTRTLFNDTNSGSTFRQWAKGIKAATGDLVWIAESDDFCNNRFLEALVAEFEDEAVMLAYAQVVFVTADEKPMPGEFEYYVSDLDSPERWGRSYVETAHNEVNIALGIKNTIPNASGVVFRRPVDMPLLDSPEWQSMRVAGDWVFYLHQIRGGKVAYSTKARNYFRRYPGSAAEATYKKSIFYKELGLAARTVQQLYNVPLEILERSKKYFRAAYDYHLPEGEDRFLEWYDMDSILKARENRQPNVLVSTMGFCPGGAEILPIRMANEFKRQGLSVLLLSAGMSPREEGIHRMLRRDVPLIETSDVAATKALIHDFGIEALNTHQWHIQKYPSQLPDVFSELGSHVASLHGMIEHGDAFGVTREQLEIADKSVTTWVYTAEKNLGPFKRYSLYDETSARFTKLPNGMTTSAVVPVSRASMGIPQDAFVLCCVSRAIPDKGWAESIASVEHARLLSGRDIRLILVGNGPIYDEYRKAGVPDFVHLAGFSENSVGYYAASDMGIMLTWFKSESFPLTIVDCLFAGKPYIASDVGDIKNMLSAGESIAGTVIELEDWEVPVRHTGKMIASFASDDEVYRRALKLVPTVAARYKIDAVAKQYIDIFRRDIELSRY